MSILPHARMVVVSVARPPSRAASPDSRGSQPGSTLDAPDRDSSRGQAVETTLNTSNARLGPGAA